MEGSSPNLINSVWMFSASPSLWITHTTAASNCKDNEKVTIFFQEKPKKENCSNLIAPVYLQFFS